MKRVMILQPPESLFAIRVIQGVADWMQTHEAWQLVIPGIHGWPARVELEKWDGEGIILPVMSRKTVQILHRLQRPFVNTTAWPDLPTVQNDNEAIGRLAAEHLLARGFTRIAYVGDTHTVFCAQRREGFSATLQNHGVPAHFHTPDEHPLTWLQKLTPPAAVLVWRDAYAFRIYQAAEALALDIPTQISVLGMDDELIGLTLSPPLSTVQPDGHRVGMESAALLQRQFSGAPPPAAPIRIPPLQVLQRKSTHAFGYEDPAVAEAMRILRERAGRGLLVDQLTTEMHISRRNLERRFKRIVGHTLWREMRNIQIEHVKSLLIGTDRPIKELAPDTAFPQPARLIKIFREETGETPAAFRRRHRSVG